MASQTFPSETTNWGQMATTVDINKVDLAHLEPQRSRLAVVADSAKATKLKQEAFKAQVQQTTRDLEALMKEGRDLFARLRNGVRTQYGLKSEKLTEFGMKPLRKPQKKATPEPVAQPTPVTHTPVDTK
jgi:hypothetical protein